jgi:hypothetical protein
MLRYAFQRVPVTLPPKRLHPSHLSHLGENLRENPKETSGGTSGGNHGGNPGAPEYRHLKNNGKNCGENWRQPVFCPPMRAREV